MRILFEEHHYKPEALKPLLVGSEINPKHVEKDTRLSLDYVGYFYNPTLKDCVFILPKVLMDGNDRVLANDDQEGLTPEELMELNAQVVQTDERKKQLLEFVYGFSVWVYRGISVYREKNPDSDIAVSPNVTQMGHGRRRDRFTFLDVVLEILQFNRQEQDYLTFIVKNMHSGMNKINWTKTISKSQAFIQNGTPVYLDPVNKKRQVNFDEELLVIFYSILNYIQNHYGFRTHINARFDLITGEHFKRYMEGYGKTRLRQIKYKYFADKALRIWELCYAFFDAAYKVAITTDTRDYLLVHDFHAVFEDMIDELLSDPDLDKMKTQEDGKILDHIYRYHGLTDHADKEDKVYYIGDSKYYPREAKVGKTSVAKQFTYARNLVQKNLDLFFDKQPHQKYRDEVTEGYDFVPNFFISAQIPEITNEGYSKSDIVPKDAENGKKFYISHQFENRLFDRDTILVAHYDVNFLFILALYARNNEGEKNNWSNRVKEQFRKEIREGLENEYDFFAMQAIDQRDAEEYIKKNFQKLLGKVYKPYSDKEILSLALDNNDAYKAENKALRTELEKHFIISGKIQLGEDPKPKIDEARQQQGDSLPDTGEKCVLVAYVVKEKDSDFISRTATELVLKNPPKGNLLKLKFLMPILSRGIQEIYPITDIELNDKGHLKVTFDNKKVEELGSRRVSLPYKPHAEIVSLEQAHKLYEGIIVE